MLVRKREIKALILNQFVAAFGTFFENPTDAALVAVNSTAGSVCAPMCAFQRYATAPFFALRTEILCHIVLQCLSRRPRRPRSIAVWNQVRQYDL